MVVDRTSGVLLHPTSLPGPMGIGDLGPAAYQFVDWLADAEQTWWQILPLTAPGPDGSPYQSNSSFAGNPVLISLELLMDDGLLDLADLRAGLAPPQEAARVDFPAVTARKMAILEKAATTFRRTLDVSSFAADYGAFCRAHAQWLDDHALFMALREANGEVIWRDWTHLVDRFQRPLPHAAADLAERIETHRFFQWAFFRQWRALREHAAARGILIMGDVPIYVAEDSADVWANRHLFQLDERGRPTHVAGVPPDYFSETGQLWNNPLYDWERMAGDGFAWWIRRVRAMLELVDVTRIDHFRGFQAFWSVPADEATAINGRWIEAPGEELFHAILSDLHQNGREPVEGMALPFVAEDLGMITPEVTALRRLFGLPGMKVMQFILPSDYADDRPECERDSVVYTGTHDNDTALGWFDNEIAPHPHKLERVRRYTPGRRETISWELIEIAWKSEGAIAIAPLQDVLSLGAEARMNKPGTTSDRHPNWSWRYAPELLKADRQARLAALTRQTGRAARLVPVA